MSRSCFPSAAMYRARGLALLLPPSTLRKSLSLLQVCSCLLLRFHVQLCSTPPEQRIVGSDWRRVALESSTIRIGSPSLNESYPRSEYPGYLSHRSLLFAPMRLGQSHTPENGPKALTTVSSQQTHSMNFMERRFLIIKT